MEDAGSFVPWRFSFLFKGNRAAYFNFLRKHNVHCSAWYPRISPIIGSELSKNDNSKLVEKSIVNFWVDPMLPDEYYDHQFKLISEGLSRYAH